MTIYLNCFSLFAIHIEINYKLGKYPFFLNEKYKTENIIHLSYITIIFTPRQKHNGHTEKNNETGNRKIHSTIA